MTQARKSSQQTPLMRQYWSIKSVHPDKILFFRMGDFYEMFHEDAIKAAPLLGITLTARNKNSDDYIPMCGVPYHSIAKPINTLLSLGHRVALCDQLEDPQFAKGLVKRGITQVFSPGIVYDPDTLEQQVPHFLTAYCQQIVSFLDITTGDAFYYETSKPSLREYLISLLKPVEFILTSQQKSEQHPRAKESQNRTYTVYDAISNDINTGIESNDRLLSYVVSLRGQKALSTIRPFEKRLFEQKMKFSSLAREHLEIFSTYKGEKKGSLFACINKTKSPLGARKLRSWMTFPLTSKEQIMARQDKIQQWQASPHLQAVRKMLGSIGDLERRIGKVSISSCHPRDLLQLSDALFYGLNVFDYLNTQGSNKIKSFETLIATARSISTKIQRTIKRDAPLHIKDGDFIQKGVSSQLDSLIDFMNGINTQLLAIEAEEKKRLDIPSLKVRHNHVFGYYIEVSHTHKNKIPPDYIRKQTLVNAERFVTEHLKNLEAKVLSTKVKKLQIEKEIFNQLRIEVLNVSCDLLFLSDQIALIDVFSSLAWLALECNYVRPEISQNEIVLMACRHPVVEKQTGLQSGRLEFVPNDIILKRSECFLITGPNMAGKSTLMRQVALNAILMQIGSFVPASQARLPIFDQIQTRIGASDMLSEGLSTFMLEMTETSEMLKESTSQTLVILDEVGRGTSTFDGMSLAQAILEHLVSRIQATVLFATHYHELTQMATLHPQIINKHIKILEDKDHKQITFLYQLADGFASKSYGVHVAKMAGLPDIVIERATQLLNMHTLSSSLKNKSFKKKSSNDSPQKQRSFYEATI